MGNPYPAKFEDSQGNTRLEGQLDFTNPSNTPAFNGGTITTPLVVNAALAPNTSDNPLDILDPNNVDSEFRVFRSVDGAGNESVYVNVASALDGDARLNLNDDNLGGFVTLRSSGGSVLSARPSAGSDTALINLGTGVRFLRDGYFVTRLHAAPADGDLGAGDCALWFDQTNGAAKLMVKAKQADGTVVTGSVNLA